MNTIRFSIWFCYVHCAFVLYPFSPSRTVTQPSILCAAFQRSSWRVSPGPTGFLSLTTRVASSKQHLFSSIPCVCCHHSTL
uniref:Putative secreted protein n=1 Tax=Anopheles marajoara TaxID=58244 RepID=A0A2M4CBG3_9DIPT